MPQPTEAGLQYLLARAQLRREYAQMTAAPMPRVVNPMTHHAATPTTRHASTSFSARALVMEADPSHPTPTTQAPSTALLGGGKSKRLFGRLARVGLAQASTVPTSLPIAMAQPFDALILSGHQVLLRQEVELFAATADDLSAVVRGRNSAIQVGQVGIRCRHCAHVPAVYRQKGSVYFPSKLHGLYQAAQNMSSNHIQCGLCVAMPEQLKEKFKELIPTKNTSSGAGRSYWADSAKQMGFVDTDEGIRFVGHAAFQSLPTEHSATAAEASTSL